MVWVRMPRKLTNFHIDPDLADGLRIVKARDGINLAEQIRRGIRMWLDTKSIKADRPRVAPRKRP